MGSESNVFDDFLRITVLRIDTQAEEAYVQITWRTARPIPRAGPATPFVGVTNDAGGFVFVPGRGLVRIPPHSPLLQVLGKMTEFQALQSVRVQGAGLDRLSTELLVEMRDRVDAIISARNEFHVPAVPARRARVAAAKASASGAPKKTRRRGQRRVR